MRLTSVSLVGLLILLTSLPSFAGGAHASGAASLAGVHLESDVLPNVNPLLPRPNIHAASALAAAVTTAEDLAAPAGSAAPRPIPVDYSDAYGVRRKIHYVASFATLPLFATEVVLGQKLYDGTGSESVRSAHGVVAGSLGVLFGVSTITGVWNLYEGRNDPSGRTWRLWHGVLMMVADAGFVATAATAPESEEGPVDTSGRSTHRTLAITSMGIATASYLIALIGR